MKRWLIIITALGLFVGARVAIGQSGGENERGIPFPSEHYAPPEYQQAPQNWAVAQDERAFMYVANNNGVLEYDGERWRLIPTSTGSFVRSLAVDSLVYVGAKGDFGYLRPDSLGVLRYRSLYDRIPPDERGFEDIWGTHIVDDAVYYQANQRLFRWDGQEITSWDSENGFHTSFSVDGTLYVRDFGRGLLRMEGDSLRQVPGGETFHETPIYMMSRHPSGDLLIGTQNRGLLLYDGNSFEPFAPQLTSYLQENDLYHGCRLPGNRYALATLGGGVIVVDADGRAVRVLDGSSGLPDDVVNYVYTDREGHLWMALNNGGVFRADLNDPLTVHDERTGLDGTVRGIYEHQDSTYVSTGSGLFVLRKEKNQVLGEQSSYFERWGSPSIVWDMLSVERDLLVATQEGAVSQITGRSKQQIGDWITTYDLLKLGNVIYAGTRSGLKGLIKENGEWRSFPIEGVQGEVRSLAIEEKGILWASTIQGDILRIVLSAEGRGAKRTTRYDERVGLPEGYKRVETIDERITVVSRTGFFQIDNANQSPKFWQFSRRPYLLPDIQGVDTLAVKTYYEDASGALWVALGNRVFVGRKSGEKTYNWESVEPLHFPKASKMSISLSGDSTLWLGDGRRLFRYAPGPRWNIDEPVPEFRSYVRQITTLNEGRVVYGGAPSALGPDSSLRLPYGHDLRLDVAAPQYGTDQSHRYRYKLVGRSTEWTNWTADASQRYRNLWEGTYQFKVQARNERGETSKIASLTLHVLPPWYRSRWAYLFYGIAFIAVAYGYRRYYQMKQQHRRARERVRKLERERVVAERLKKANERLREANRLKEDFLATTSHELRTPLTNILGSIDVVRDMATEEQERFLTMMEKSGERLKRTLNALLDLSMLRSGDEDLDLTPIPINECACRVASDLRASAEEKGLSFWVNAPEASVEAKVDEQYLDQILRNLIENAIKFTDEGHVGVSVGQTDGRVFVEVEDTGIGMDEEFLPDLFEEFKQESRGRARAYEGNGLGLAISSRLVDEMDGTIRVDTVKGEGSTFRVEFPRASAEASSGSEEA